MSEERRRANDRIIFERGLTRDYLKLVYSESNPENNVLPGLNDAEDKLRAWADGL